MNACEYSKIKKNNKQTPLETCCIVQVFLFLIFLQFCEVHIIISNSPQFLKLNKSIKDSHCPSRKCLRVSPFGHMPRMISHVDRERLLQRLKAVCRNCQGYRHSITFDHRSEQKEYTNDATLS